MRRRGFLSCVCAIAVPVSVSVSGCAETEPEGQKGEQKEETRPAIVTAIRVPEFRPNSTPTVPLKDLDSNVLETAIERANEPSDPADTICYGGGPEGTRSLFITSMRVERDEGYERAREALDSTPSVEMGDPYCFGGTVIEHEGELYLVRMSG